MTTEFAMVVWNTLLVCTFAMIVAIPVSIGLAIALVRCNIWGRSWAWVAIGSQLAVPLYVFAGGWNAGVGMQGWLSSLSRPLTRLALEAGTGSIAAVSLIHAAAAIPWCVFILSLGLLWTHRSQEDIALLDGGLAFVLRFSVFAKLRIWILACCWWCALPVLTEMVVSNLYQVPTVAEQVYLDASRGSIEPWTYILAAIACIVPLALVGSILLFRSPPWHAIVASIAHHRSPVLQLGKWRTMASGFVWFAVLLLVAMPIINLLIKAGWQPALDSAGTASYGWSWQRLATTLYESLTLFSGEYSWSATLAVCSSVTALASAGLLRLLCRNLALRNCFSLLMLALVAVPGPLVGLWTIWIFNRSQPAVLGLLYDNSLVAVIFAQQFRLLPLAWLLVATILATVSAKTYEQAELDGLQRSQLFWRVLLPQTRTHWFAAMLLLAVTSVGELSCSILVLPPGVTTISMRLFEMLHFGMRHQDSALCGALLLAGWFVSFSIWKTLNER